jgi:hypothetical protein
MMNNIMMKRWKAMPLKIQGQQIGSILPANTQLELLALAPSCLVA